MPLDAGFHHPVSQRPCEDSPNGINSWTYQNLVRIATIWVDPVSLSANQFPQISLIGLPHFHPWKNFHVSQFNEKDRVCSKGSAKVEQKSFILCVDDGIEKDMKLTCVSKEL